MTLGTPHLGISKIPVETSNTLIEIADFILYPVIYSRSFQEGIGPCNIFRYRGKEAEFKVKTDYLVKLNNLDRQDMQFRRRIANLKKFVSVGYQDEAYLHPKESIFFGYFSPGTCNFRCAL